jgi:hypothetical protein
MIPLMGFCYMLQYMDKLVLSQSTLLGILADLVCHDTYLTNGDNNLMDANLPALTR